ncbi:MAG: 2-dehydropantoate 2-reductase [Chloroflexi bacterium]|nr:2-dehydropantoate 2-reductase [Chloroflexota bacterium]
MRILIVGAGSLGTVVGAALAASGQDVVVYCRPHQRAALQREGLQVRGVRELQASVHASCVADEIGPVDYLLLTVKTRDTRAALDAVRAVPVGAAASLQNGLDKDEQLAAVFGAERVLGAATILGATAEGPGRALWTLAGRTYVGELQGPPTPRVEALVAAFNAAGLPATAVEDARAVEWSKLCQIVPAAALSALTRLEYYKVCKEPHLAGLFVELTRECAAVARADGVTLGDYEGFNPRTLATLPHEAAVAVVVGRGREMEVRGLTAMRISLLQDLLRGRPTEVEETLGYVVRRAAALGVAVPQVRFAYEVIRGLETYG